MLKGTERHTLNLGETWVRTADSRVNIGLETNCIYDAAIALVLECCRHIRIQIREHESGPYQEASIGHCETISIVNMPIMEAAYRRQRSFEVEHTTHEAMTICR